MNRHFASALLVGLFSLACATAAAAEIEALNASLKAAQNFQYGQDAGPLKNVERIVTAAAKDPAETKDVEFALLQALRSSGSRDSKGFICRQLVTVGGPASVPVLEEMLTDPALAHMARFALARYALPEADAALVRALGKTSGVLQVGIINSLGARRYAKAIPELKELLSSNEALVAQAAAGALGDIGGTAAVKILSDAREKASGELLACIDSALLAAARQLLAAGDRNAARQIFEIYIKPGQPDALRVAGLTGMVEASSEKALPLLSEAMKGDDELLRSVAIGLARSAKGGEATLAYAGLLPSLAPDGQVMLLDALKDRADSAALKAVLAATKATEVPVRAAAFAALGSVGGGSSVELLARTAAEENGAVQQAARASLVRLSGTDVDAALIKAMNSGEAGVQVETVRALGARHTAAASGELLKTAASPDATLRRESIRALGATVDEQSYSQLVALAVALKDAEDQAVAEQALVAGLQRLPSGTQTAPLLSVLPGASADSKPMVLRVLGTTGNAEALQAVTAALKDPSPAVSEAAIRTLAEWPDVSAANALAELARTVGKPAHKVLALRGYIRLAGQEKNSGALYARAMELAERVDDKKLVLSSLASADPADAVRLAEPCLSDEKLQVEAAQVLVQAAEKLRQSDRNRARTLMAKVLEVSKDERVRQQAQEVLERMEPLEGYILYWVIAGPYQEKDKEGNALLDVVFDAEKAGADDVKWVKPNRGVGAWDINLAEIYSGGNNCVAYLKTRVWSPKAGAARLEMGSDDGIKVWFNGAVVHKNAVNRGIEPRKDIVNVELKEGWNDLLLKVSNGGGGWGAACRVRGPDGKAIAGLKVEASL